MVALNTAYAAPKNAADPKNRVGDFFYEDHASVGKNRWANRLNTQEKSCYHYETASGRSNWPNRDPIYELGSAIMSYDFNWESTVKLWLYREYAIILNIYNQFTNSTGPISKGILDRYNEAFDAIYFYLQYFTAKMDRAFFRGSFDELNKSLFVANNPINFVDILGLQWGRGTGGTGRPGSGERNLAPSGPSGPSPSTASTAGSVAQNATQPNTDVSAGNKNISGLGGTISKVGGAAVGMGLSTSDFLSQGDNAQNVAQGIGAPMSRNELINAYTNGDIDFSEFQERLEQLRNKLCK
jgi:hypothetical protein